MRRRTWQSSWTAPETWCDCGEVSYTSGHLCWCYWRRNESFDCQWQFKFEVTDGFMIKWWKWSIPFFFRCLSKFIELICLFVFVWTLCGREVEFQMKLVSVHVLNFFSIFLLVITTTEQLFTWRPWEAPKDAWNAFWNTIPKVSISWTRTRWAYMEYNIVACEIGVKSAVIKWSFEYQDSDPN